jgi:hypothetical protein
MYFNPGQYFPMGLMLFCQLNPTKRIPHEDGNLKENLSASIPDLSNRASPFSPKVPPFPADNNNRKKYIVSGFQTKGALMNVDKTGNATIQMRQDAAAAAQKRADQAQQDQQKQMQAQEAKKVREEKQGSALKGGEINITA